MSANTSAAWRDGMQAVNDEAGGLLDVNIIDASRGAELLVEAMFGNRGAANLLRAVAQASTKVRQAPRHKPALCMCCPRPVKRISPATVFGVAFPAVSDPANAIGFVFCERCAADRGALIDKTAEGLRRIWPDARPVAVTHPSGGHA